MICNTQDVLLKILKPSFLFFVILSLLLRTYEVNHHRRTRIWCKVAVQSTYMVQPSIKSSKFLHNLQYQGQVKPRGKTIKAGGDLQNILNTYYSPILSFLGALKSNRLGIKSSTRQDKKSCLLVIYFNYASSLAGLQCTILLIKDSRKLNGN